MNTINNILKVNIKLSIIIMFSITAIFTTGCSKNEDMAVTPVADNNKKITSFVFLLAENPIAVNILGTINEDTKTITALMPPGTDITALLPAIEIASNSQVSPNTPQDFTNPVAYTVSAEDGSEVVYTATVGVALSQRQILQTILDANPGHLLNWDLQNTADLGTLTGVTTNIEGHITKMSLAAMDIHQLPLEIGQLTGLKELRLENNQQTSIPSEIGQLTNLTKLILYNNLLVTIPSEIGQLTNLTKLDFGQNQLTSIPSEIGQLTNLIELRSFTNQITTLPTEIGQLTNLKILTIGQNQLTTIPSSIGQMANLTELYLRSNQLITIPSEIGQLTNLSLLALEDNQLTTIPSTIGQLTSLRELNLSHNQLTSIPPEIGKLTLLGQLYIGHNQLTSLPPEIGFLTKLSFLYINGNPLTAIPQAICYLEEYNNPNMEFEKDASTPCVIISPNDALIGIYSSNPNNTLGWHTVSFLGIDFDGNHSVTKIEIQNKGIERIPASVSSFQFCKLLDLRDNPLSFIADEVCALIFTSTVGFSILTDPGEGC